MQWKTAESPRSKKARISKSKIKVILIAFFNQKVMVNHEFVPEEKTANKNFHNQVLIRLHNRVRRSRRELWSYKSRLLHYDNAPAHKTISVRQLLVKKQITALDHPPYFPDLAPCDFWLFPRLKAVMKGTHFLSLEEIKASVTRKLKRLKEEGFTKCFCGWQIECKSVLTWRESTLKRIIHKLSKYSVLKFLEQQSDFFCHTS